MQTTVLVAGGDSAVGRTLVEEFVHRGHQVRATHASRRGADAGTGDVPASIRRLNSKLDGDIEWYEVDWSAVSDAGRNSQAVSAVEGARVAVDATGWARTSPADLDDALREAVSSTRALLSLAEEHRVGRVVHVADPLVLGDGGASGSGDAPLSEDDEYTPGSSGSWPPAEAAYAAQMEAYRFVQRGLPVVMAIPGIPYGPGAADTALGRLLGRLWRGALPVTSGGDINVVDVRDVAASVTAMATQGRPGRQFVLGGHNVAVADLFETAAEIGGVDPPGRHVPSRLVEQTNGVTDAVIGRLTEAVESTWVSSVARTMGVRVGSSGEAPLGWVGELHRLVRGRSMTSERAVNELNHRARPFNRTLTDSFEQFEADRSTGH